MRTHPLVYANTVVIALLVAGAAFLYLRERGSGRDLLDPDAGRDLAATHDAAGLNDEALRRVDALETRLAELARRLEGGSGPAEEAGEAGEKTGGGSSVAEEEGDSAKAGGGAVEDHEAPVSRSEVKALVRKELGREIKRREDEARKKAEEQEKEKKKKKPRITVAEFSKQMGLDASQENELRATVRNLQKDVVKLLFEVEKDEDLETLKQQIKQSEYDPDLKASLKEKAGINYFVKQKDLMVLFVKAHTHLGKVLTPEQRKAVDRYDLQLSNPEFPDLEAWFEEDGEEGEKD